MADDVATPLNIPIAPAKEEKIEKTLFDVIIFQQPHEEKLSRRVV
jgi:hypothetical protein